MIQDILAAVNGSGEIIIIFIEILAGTIMTFTAIITFGKSRRISILFFIITAVLLYFSMSLRILGDLNIFAVEKISVKGIPLLKTIINSLPLLTMTFAFIFYNKRM